MKKALDQTVRSVKREVNKKVLKVPEIERKVLEATCNEPWGPHGTLMADIAQATRNYNEYQMIMTILWKRLNDSGKNWRHVMKSLTVMEFLVGHGAERFIDELREHTYQIQTLVDFQYIDSRGRDQGINVRRKAQALVALVNDKERIRECRQKAAANRDKYRQSGMYRSSSYTSTGPTYGDRDDDERYGGYGGGSTGDRYRDRDRDRDDRYDDRYRDGDRQRDGERYRDEGRYGYRDGDRYDGPERERDRGGYEDARSSGSKDDDDWRGERRQPKGGRPSPPRYEEVASPSEAKPNGSAPAASEKAAPSVPVENGTVSEAKPEEPVVDEFDPRGAMHASASDQDLFGQTSAKLAPTQTAPASLFGGVEELFADPSPAFPATTSEVNVADTNPFGSSTFRATSLDNSTTDAAPFHSSEASVSEADALALVLTDQPPPAAEQPPAYSHFQPEEFRQPPPPPQAQQFTQAPPQAFAPQPQAQQFPSQSFPQPTQAQQFQQQPPQAQQFQQQPTQNMVAQQQQQQQQPPQAPQQQLPQVPYFRQQPTQSFGAVQFPPQQTAPGYGPPQQQFPFGHQQQPFPPPTFAHQQQSPFPPQQQQQSSFQQPQPLQASQQPAQPVQSQTSVHTKAKKQEKFEPKSAVWADTLSSGLVDLNIGPLKHDPLAEMGIHLVESKVSQSERRKLEKPAVSATKGAAMGSGSGLGIAGASVMHRALPPPPPIMGGGMGGGMGGMGMGMGGMNPMMGPMMPPPGMNGQVPMMNPMMGMGMGMGMGGGFSNPQQSQFGGYR